MNIRARLRKGVLAGMVFFAAALWVGCGTSETKPAQTIQLWTHWEGRELEILREESAVFEKAHEGVRVEISAGIFETFSQDIEQSLRKGEAGAPDVFTGINDWIGNFAEKNLILAIDQLPNEMPDEFLSYTYESAKYKGKLYAFPVSYECVALFYNRKLVTAAPQILRPVAVEVLVVEQLGGAR